jgi:hypothetical protein
MTTRHAPPYGLMLSAWAPARLSFARSGLRRQDRARRGIPQTIEGGNVDVIGGTTL